MVQLGYALSSEEHDSRKLVDLAVRAERSGFEIAMISDHFHPWLDVQGESPFVWGVLGAIAMQTNNLRVGTGVTCPIQRIHPVIVAQAAATAASLMPGRFFLGLGSGEALNEHVTGERWPPVDTRQEMLEESIVIIRKLWKGGQVDHRGKYYTVDNARIYSRPDQSPPIYIGASGPGSVRIAAEHGNGLISTMADAKLAEVFRAAGNSGPRLGSVTVCWAETEAEAEDIAFKYWPNAALKGAFKNELPLPSHFEQAISTLRKEDVAKVIVCGPDPEKHLKAIQEYADAGYDYVFIHNVGPEQEGFFDFYERQILPQSLKASSQAGAEPAPEVADDKVSEASWESFPASDPPGWRR